MLLVCSGEENIAMAVRIAKAEKLKTLRLLGDMAVTRPCGPDQLKISNHQNDLPTVASLLRPFRSFLINFAPRQEAITTCVHSRDRHNVDARFIAWWAGCYVSNLAASAGKETVGL